MFCVRPFFKKRSAGTEFSSRVCIFFCAGINSALDHQNWSSESVLFLQMQLFGTFLPNVSFASRPVEPETASTLRSGASAKVTPYSCHSFLQYISALLLFSDTIKVLSTKNKSTEESVLTQLFAGEDGDRTSRQHRHSVFGGAGVGISGSEKLLCPSKRMPIAALLSRRGFDSCRTRQLQKCGEHTDFQRSYNWPSQ